MAEYFGIDSPERLIFTPGCTQSINMVLQGIGFKSGDLVIVSGIEHNAVMRPLKNLEQTHGIQVKALRYCPGSILCLKELEELLKKRKPRLCVFMEASNVTGEILDLQAVSEMLAVHEVPLLVDAAQSAGVFHRRISELHALKYWCASGHKGLFGMAGVGLLYVRSDEVLEPLVFGGTGSRSEELNMPSAYPDHLEAGTMPGPAIVSLSAGLDFIQELGAEKIAEHELELCSKFVEWMSARKEFRFYGQNSARRIPLVSFEIAGMDSGRVAELLDREYEICVRAGLHCASSAHRSLGTVERGLIRASFSYFNNADELRIFTDVLAKIASSG